MMSMGQEKKILRTTMSEQRQRTTQAKRKKAVDAIVDALLQATRHPMAERKGPPDFKPLIKEEDSPIEDRKTLFYYKPFYPQASRLLAEYSRQSSTVRPIPPISATVPAPSHMMSNATPPFRSLSFSVPEPHCRKQRDMITQAQNLPRENVERSANHEEAKSQDPLPAASDDFIPSPSMQKGSSSLLSSNAYMRRNVYKSIIRHMFSYIRKNRAEIIKILRGNGFEMAEIEHAFFKINYFNDLEREKGNPKRSQTTLRKILAKRSVYTYILRETLFAMINNWKRGKIGKISAANLEVYREVCNTFYAEAVNTLSHPAQGTSFLL